MKSFRRRRIPLAALFLVLFALPLSASASRPPADAETLVLPGGEQVEIIRDGYGVPHIYAESREGVAFGAGYALAQDRLWQMEVLRNTAKGQLSDLLGAPGTPIRDSLRSQDRTVRFFTYTADERARRYATYPADMRSGIEAFVEGINTWIVQAQLPQNRPFEFDQFGIPITDWTVDDTIAMQDALILAFGSGGGNELTNAALLSFLIGKYGQRDGLRAFKDVVWTNDPDSPPSIPAAYHWKNTPTYARAEADSAFKLSLHLTDARLSLSPDQQEGGPAVAASSTPIPGDEDAALLQQMSLVPDLGPVQEALGMIEGLEALKTAITFGSNAQIVGPGQAEFGNSLQTAGPQVGYYVPQILADFGLHGGGIDAVGMTFAGAGPAVLIGRGKGYAWTTTTGASDLTDTYVEKLNPSNRRQYLFGDRWENMDCRTETYTFRGAPVESEEICRTRHGPVLSFDTTNHVAYSLKYSWFNAERGTVEGFFKYNTVSNLEDFGTAANMLTSNHNMLYSDDRGNSGYWHPGAHPIRQSTVDLRLPQDGSGNSEWKGIRRAQQVPHAVNLPRGWLANWNNKPSVDWDRDVGWGAVHKVRSIFDVLDPNHAPRPGPDGAVFDPDGKQSWDDLNANLRYAAFREHDADFFLPFLPEGGGDDQEARALDEVRGWNRFLTDDNSDCRWDSAGAAISRRWASNMRALAFNDDLGPQSGRSSTSMLWHVLAGSQAALRPRFDWLAGESTTQLASRAFTLTVDQLTAEFANADPSTWKERASYQHYTRMNADLAADAARSRTCPYAGGASPGDIPDHVRMDRGTFNHIVAYLDSPALAGPLGQSRERSGSVIPPGQSGFINGSGVESPPAYPVVGCSGAHYRDQFGLYQGWTYKPMPLARPDVVALAECTEVISR